MKQTNKRIEQNARRSAEQRQVSRVCSCAVRWAYTRWGVVMRRLLVMVTLAVALGLMPLFSSACGTGKAEAQPSLSPLEQPRLLNLGDFALLKARPTRILLHVDQAQRLRIAFLAEQAVKSCSLWHVAASDGSLVTPEQVPLEGGQPHGSGLPISYWFGTQSLAAGYYRLDLSGHGRIATLIVDRRR